MTGTRLSLFAAALLAGLLALAALADPKPAGDSTVGLLLDQLGDRDYAQREAAEATLVARGEAILGALRVAADTHPSPEVRWRARRAWNRVMFTIAAVSKSTGMKLALILPGEFEMGSPAREAGRRPDEQPHTARLSKRFLIGQYEVTQTEYRAVTDGNPSWFATTGDGRSKISGMQTGPFPVESVTWFDAVAFCNALSKKDGYKEFYALADIKRVDGAIVSATVKRVGGNGYRLPTEAEWEHACRAGTAAPFHFGRTPNGGEGNFKTIQYGGYGGTTERPSKGRTTAVGEYRPNGWGVYEMHGNAAEWCDDWYDPAYYPKAPADDPPGPETGDMKAVRGGSWLVTHTSCRSASRAGLKPGESNNATGFRVARTP